ncbi:uncharacterized protein LOC133184121 [Saccostrea echinata]|uniref:uncharacterized protein LOC133184121 n=1 Tax=Saccostrea echinata TaxID=191078 RepID=UPI002A83C851|nr:uncharacterized protein LOC133184121 [Saccostrea echinata]
MAEPASQSVQRSSEFFEENILQRATDNEELKLFANAIDFEEKRFFLKTKFHETFVKVINGHRKRSWTYEAGLNGLGKTSSILYYVLDCQRKNDLKIHYFDLQEITKKDKQLKQFTTHSETLKNDDCLIIDHITLYNSHYLDKIREIVQSKHLRFILIETGCTASAHRILTFGRKFQLDEESFLKIWDVTKTDPEIGKKGKEVYKKFSERFIMTPRLLRDVLEFLENYKCLEYGIDQALAQYTIERRLEISEFRICDATSNLEFAQFQRHTRFLLHYIPKDKDYILTEQQALEFKIAINLFEMEYCHVKDDDLESNVEIIECGLSEGDSYVRIRHLVPFLVPVWRAKLPYNLEMVLDDADKDDILCMVFQDGGARKQFVKLLVEVQKKTAGVLLPVELISETYYTPSQRKMDVPSTSSCKLETVSRERFYEGNEFLENRYLDDTPKDLKSHEKTVALCAAFIKRNVAWGTFLVYPQIDTFMGFDYFVYTDRRKGSPPPPKVAKDKSNSKLYLIKVATGVSHSGDAMGRSLDIMKRIFADENVTLHAVVITARNDIKQFTLLRCSFENITVLNLYSKNSTNFVQSLLQSNNCLNKLYLQLIKM